MTREVQSTITVEIDLTVIGKFIPGTPERGPTYDCGGEPAEPDAIEDVEITHATMNVHNPDCRPSQPLLTGPTRWLSKSILEGVNIKSPDVQKLLANIAECAANEIEGALIDEVAE